MVDRILFEGSTMRLAPSTSRGDLTVKSPPASAELPQIAVSGANNPQKSDLEDYPEPRGHAALGELWSDLRKIENNEQKRKELEQIRGRLLGYREAARVGETSMKDEVDTDIKLVSALAEDKGVPDERTQPQIIGQKKEATNAAERVSEADRDRVLARIEQALKNVGKLRSALDSDTQTAYERMVNLNSSVNDLNLARSRVDDAEFGLRSASDTVDAVLLHMRTAVVAHGKMSPELVRLVLN